MKKMKHLAICLLFSMTLISVMTACRDKNKETESVLEQITETNTETETDMELEEGVTTSIQTKTYISKDKTVSIELPDTSWENTRDTGDTLIFEAPAGTITITHMAGSGVSSLKFPKSKEEVVTNLQNSGKDITKYEVTDFKKEKYGTKDQYFTIVKCSDPAENYVYSVGYDLVSSTDIYSITGLVKQDDTLVLDEIKTSVDSFRVIKDGTSIPGMRETSDSDAQGNTKVIYDSNGKAITVTKDSTGKWSDSTGKTYDVQEYGAMGSDGYWYTYQGKNDSSNSQRETQATETNEEDPTYTIPTTSGFYDHDGNYITVKQDANGNWVDSYGTTYYFGDDGVTDNAGNYYPYNRGGNSGTGGNAAPGETSGTGGSGTGSGTGGESNGFYNSNGEYITVIKDANGNWVDSSGAIYKFGDTGVTDEAGHFYPY